MTQIELDEQVERLKVALGTTKSAQIASTLADTCSRSGGRSVGFDFWNPVSSKS